MPRLSPVSISFTGLSRAAHELGCAVLGGVVDDDHLVHGQIAKPIECHRQSVLPVAGDDHGADDGHAYDFHMAPGSLPPLALAYHAVGDVPLRDDPHGLFVRAEDLRLHIAKLREWGYRLVSFGQLAALAAENEAGGHAALTFDDGFVDNLDTLAPLLAELAAPATVFVVSGWLGKPHRSAPWTRVVSAEELRALHVLGVEIGAHSVTHPDLSRLGLRRKRSPSSSRASGISKL